MIFFKQNNPHKITIISMIVLFVGGVFVGTVAKSGYQLLSTSLDSVRSKTIVEVPIRGMVSLGDEDESFGHTFGKMEIDVNKTALLLIDVWDDHADKELLELTNKNIEEYLSPVIQEVRKTPILVMHAPHSGSIHPLVAPIDDEVVIESGAATDVVRMDRILRHNKIETIIYAGYHSNECVSKTRNVSTYNMAKMGYRVLFVRDASISSGVIDGKSDVSLHNEAIAVVEKSSGFTTTAGQLIKELKTLSI